MDLKKTGDNLLQTIEKLEKMRNELINHNKVDSNEFVMLLEVKLQCVALLATITAICEKGAAYILSNLSDIAKVDRQANEYVQLVESV